MPLKYDKLLRVKATPYAVAQGVDVWDERDAKICVENNGGLKSVAYEIVGYVAKWALRTPCETNTNIYNIGPDGGFGMRMVAYDHANCPAMRINIK